MTTLFRTVLIESAEQAEALPIGTVAQFEPGSELSLAAVKNAGPLPGWWLGDERVPVGEVPGYVAFVPIEAEDERDTAKAEKDQANDSAEDASYPLIVMQDAILTAVADALNGPPPPLTSWSHHDLGPKAVELVARAANADATLRRVRELVDRHGATDPDVLLEKLDLEVTGTPPVLRPRSPRTTSRPSIEMPRSPEETP